jgi:RNA polymerase sigma-70 factor (ECF subfamily)
VGRAAVEGAPTRAAAFQDLVDRHLDASYRLARAIVGDPFEAEDATHDAIVRAWRQWPTLRDRDRFEAWFHRILVNTCRNRLRQRRTLRPIEGSVELSVADEGHVGRPEEREWMGEALARVSPDHRAVLALRYYLDLPLGEIATRLGIPEGTVSSRIHYALAALRSALEELERQEAGR